MSDTTPVAQEEKGIKTATIPRHQLEQRLVQKYGRDIFDSPGDFIPISRDTQPATGLVRPAGRLFDAIQAVMDLPGSVTEFHVNERDVVTVHYGHANLRAIIFAAYAALKPQEGALPRKEE